MVDDIIAFLIGALVGIGLYAAGCAILETNKQIIVSSACGECEEVGKICGLKVCTSEDGWK